MDAAAAAAAATLLSPTSSTDAVSSASLMMIAQQFFQHQYQHQHQQQQLHDCDELLLPSFSQQQQQTSMNLTSCWNTINHHHEQQQEAATHLSHCTSIVEEDVTAYLDGFSPPGTPPHAGEQHKKEDEDWMDFLMMGSCISEEAGGATAEHPSESSHSSELLTPDDIWREHFGLNLASSSRRSGDELWSSSLHAPQVSISATATATMDACSQQQQESLEQLIQLLVSCLDDIDKGNAATATSTLATVKATASTSGSAVQKCASYFASGLEARMDRAVEERHPDGSPESIATAYKTLTDACPYLKFAHLTANQALLEAIEGARNIHIVDYGTMQGVQWAAFLQAFATWPSSAKSSRRKLRITGIPSPLLGSDPASAMLATRRRLTDFARLLGVDFEFHPVVQPIGEFQPSQCPQLGCRGDEVVAVNFVLQLAQLPAVALHRAFSLVQRLNPRIVTVAEYEANNGTARAQLASNARFYCAVLESMDVTLPRDHAPRIHAEKLFFGAEIRRSLARAASREEASEWQRCIDSAGLWSAPLSHYTVSQARLLLWLYNKSDNFTLVQGPGSLSLGWLGTSIVTVSAWHC